MVTVSKAASYLAVAFDLTREREGEGAGALQVFMVTTIADATAPRGSS